MTGVFLQARLDSTRLPRKAVLPLEGKPLVLRCMEALKKVKAGVYSLLTEEGSRETLAPIAEAAGFLLFIGSKEDVLDRYCSAAEAYGADFIVRATGDNPLVSWELAGELLDQCLGLEADYGGFAGMPVGCGVEVLKAEALFRARRETADPYDREHVAPYLYKNPQIFRLHRPLVRKEFQSARRVTVDTREDYEFMKTLYRKLPGGGPPSLAELFCALKETTGPGGFE